VTPIFKAVLGPHQFGWNHKIFSTTTPDDCFAKKKLEPHPFYMAI
jgi:hypothetical protein